MSWEVTLNVTAPGYDVTCRELFVTPIPDIAGIGVRAAIYTQVFVALACHTFSSTDKFTHQIQSISSQTFIALTITSLVFLFGAPTSAQLIGLGRLRVLLALSTISYGPGFLNVFQQAEKQHFAPLTHASEEGKKKADAVLKANSHIIDFLAVTPVAIIFWGGMCAQVVLFGVCVSRLTGPRTVNAARFCGFDDIAMTPLESVGWCFLALVIPWAMPFFPLLMVAIWKSDPVHSWRRHVRKKNITAAVGKLVYWGYASMLCALTERFLSEDPARFVPGDDEVEWTFGQTLPIVMLFPMLLGILGHLAKLPWYPIPDFQPAHSRLTLYLHLFSNYHNRWFNLRKFVRLSTVMFLHEEHDLWILKAESPSEIQQRRKQICGIRREIRQYVEMSDSTDLRTISELDAERLLNVSPLEYMDSVLEVLKPESPTRKLRKVKSFPLVDQLAA